jgi:hypothetical protein
MGAIPKEFEGKLQCDWFALCKNKATKTRSHPILVEVPICDRCDKKVERLST